MDLANLPERYRLILCDLWGCVHDGANLFPGVVARLEAWRAEGRQTIFLTNAPRSGDAVREQLNRLGLPPGLDQGIVTAGDAGAAALQGRPVGFCGTEADRADLEARGLTFIDRDYDELACAGLVPGETVSDFAGRLEAWRRADVLLHCLNPDRVVQHRGEMLPCAGAIADAYEAMGGRTRWYGKPYPAIYELALATAGVADRNAVLAIGDGLVTDMAGAAAFGIDAVYVAGGIHAGEEARFPDGWHPVGTVEALGTAAGPGA